MKSTWWCLEYLTRSLGTTGYCTVKSRVVLSWAVPSEALEERDSTDRARVPSLSNILKKASTRTRVVTKTAFMVASHHTGGP